MTEAKKAITILCKHIKLLLNFEVNPDDFMLAKMNKSENNVVLIFWRLLNRFLKYKSDNLVENVKINLAKLGYCSSEFYKLPENMSSGSKELLLVLGFLLSKGYLNNLVAEELISTPFNTNLDLYLFSQDNFQENYLEMFSLRDENDLLSCMEWLKGRIIINERIQRDYEEKAEEIKEKIVKKIAPFKDKLSIAEVLYLKNNIYGQKFINDTERIRLILKIHEEWLKKEYIFWKWMESIVD